jgi:ABC-2 type transport system permease protein
VSGFGAVGEVARWEFVRWAKPNQQVIGLVSTVVILLLFSFINRFGDDPPTIDVAVVGAEHLATLPEAAGRFEFRRHAAGDEARLRDAVEAREVTALLVLAAGGAGELVTRQDRGWRQDLERELTVAAALQRMRDAGIDPATLAAIQAPFQLELRETAPRAGRTERVTALIAIGLMLYGLFTGMAYIFASVTGEKQQRLSEQVVSAIPAQTWIDGKILGLAAVALVNMVVTVIAVFLWLAARRLIWGDPIPAIPAVEQPALLALAVGFILLGFFFWFATITAFAALVDDPHTSNRSQILFVPILFTVPGFLALIDDSAAWVHVLSLAPPTSASVMPARILVADVAAWEVALSALLLLAATHLVRRAAGKVFRLGMLMYGKEPAWGEVRRWLREA